MSARFTVTLPIPFDVRSWIRETDRLVNQQRTRCGEPAGLLTPSLPRDSSGMLPGEGQGTGLVFEDTSEGLAIRDAGATASLDYLAELLQAAQRHFGLSDTWSFTYASSFEQDGVTIFTGGVIAIRGERVYRHDALALQQPVHSASELPPAPQRLDELPPQLDCDLHSAENVARALLQPLLDVASPEILRAAQKLLEVRPGAATSFVSVHAGDLLEGADPAVGAASLATAQEAILEARRALLSAGRPGRPVAAIEAAFVVARRSARAELENRTEEPDEDLLSP